MMTNQTTRVLDLLKRFNQNKKVCIAQLQNDYLWDGKSEKTIRRDLDVIKVIFPESFELIRGGESGCYKAITKEAFDNFMKPSTLSLMVQTFSLAQHSDLFNNLDMDDDDKRIIESKIKDLKKVYEFKSKPFENKSSDAMIFKKLENAITYKKEILIDYEVPGAIKQMDVKPYKIVFMNENFYLACEAINESYSFSVYRISKIQEVIYANRTFHHNPDIVSFIKTMQTPLATYKPNFKEHLVEVLVEVDTQKAIHFKAKKYLTSQTILEEKENGNLLIQFTVTQDIELKDLIKRWIPYVKVISPLSLKEKIAKDIAHYLEE